MKAGILALVGVLALGAGVYFWRARGPRADTPVNFGYKCTWLAIRGATAQSVAETLGLERVGPSNWKNGVDAAYEGRVFVSPPLRGWILVATAFLPDPGDREHPDRATPFLASLVRAFPEVQYFASHRVVGLAAWARAVEGRFVRKFAYSGEQGEVPWDIGSPTPEEVELGLVFSANQDEWQHYPDEKDVVAVAGAWSVDPSTLESQGFSADIGLVGSWPGAE